jgi:uncharacterized protein YcsI (UPF0317 family)
VPELGEDLDIRDLPRNGDLVAETEDVRDFWRDDLVSFVIGCSFSFEEALMAEASNCVTLARGCNVPMYHTSIAAHAGGPFHGPMVLSMRPLRPADAIRAVQITTRFPAVHGAPVHIGKPELIGIADVMNPDYSDAVPVNDVRAAGILGLRRDAAIGDCDGEAGVLHHALPRQHAGDRPKEFRNSRLCDPSA